MMAVLTLYELTYFMLELEESCENFDAQKTTHGRTK